MTLTGVFVTGTDTGIGKTTYCRDLLRRHPGATYWKPVQTGWPEDDDTRAVEAGYFASFSAGRIGRDTRLPVQFGQRPPSFVSAQSRQKVHSNEQIIASAEAGGRSLSQHSQFGRSASMGISSVSRRR